MKAREIRLDRVDLMMYFNNGGDISYDRGYLSLSLPPVTSPIIPTLHSLQFNTFEINHQVLN